MGVANQIWTTAAVESAIFRSEGIAPASMLYGPAPNPDPAAGFRSYTPTGSGHLNVHVEGVVFDGAGGGAIGHKSRYQNATMAVKCITEALNSGMAGGRSVNSHWLQYLDDHPGAQLWLAGNGGGPKNGPGIAVTGAFYGYQPRDGPAMRAPQGSANEVRAAFVERHGRPARCRAATPVACPGCIAPEGAPTNEAPAASSIETMCGGRRLDR